MASPTISKVAFANWKYEATFTLAATFVAACRQGLAMTSLVGVSHYWLPRQRIRFLAAKYKHFGGKRLNMI